MSRKKKEYEVRFCQLDGCGKQLTRKQMKFCSKSHASKHRWRNPKHMAKILNTIKQAESNTR